MLLDRDSAWNYGDMFRLIRLLGKYPIEAINDPELNAIFLAWDAVVPGRAERFWKECKQCKPLQDPGFSDFGRWREIADRPADAAAAIKFFDRLIDEQIERLEELLELHGEIAGDEAAEVADRASCDSSTRGERLRREQTAKGRELRHTVELLLKMRKGENTDRVAGDGGKVKAGESPAMETPATAKAPEVAMPSEEKREPMSTSKPACQKRKRDKYRSMSALEMAMSERLDEQGFEKFFADPPAALVVIKGLQKLAELKVLPGRAPVRGSEAGHRSMSDLGWKKVPIEANDGETQDGKQQENMANALNSGGEKRSQFNDRGDVATKP